MTFLFTDVVGSTRSWAADPSGMSDSLKLHDRVVRAAIEHNGGYVFSTGGDGFAVAFAAASAGIAAAGEAQRALGDLEWGSGPALQVRMGLHLGETEERGGDYFGPPVNTAARIQAAANGGQVLLSHVVGSAAGLAEDLHDLGSVRLRDVPEPVHLYQLGDGEFPPPRSADAVESTLPRPRTSLVGRDEDITEIRRLLVEHRLVTLSAVGGAGKTRLAIEVASRELDERTEAAFFIDLSTIETASEVGAAFASGLNFIPSSVGPVMAQVRSRIGDRSMLLLVDNCEHVVDEAADQIDLLISACPGVTILATSREALDLEGETVLRLDPLSTSAEAGAASAAVELFRRRAADLGVALSSDDETMATLEEICRRLDGLPLAIELAAARTTALSPQQILDRLDDRFALLASRRRRTAARQQTLAATIAWSYELLDDDEQHLLNRLSVFPASFDLEAVEAVGECDPSQSVRLVESLISKSLMQPSPHPDSTSTARYRILETVRAFAHQQLSADAERIDEVRLRYARHISERIARQAPWAFAPLSHDLEMLADDLVPAIEIANAAGDHALVGRIAADAFPLWALMGKHAEADDWLSMAEDHLDGRNRSRCLSVQWSLNHWLPGRASRAAKVAQRGLESHPLEDQPWGWFSLLGLGLSQYVGHPAAAATTIDRARESIAWANHPRGATQAIDWLEGLASLWTGDHERATERYGVGAALDENDVLLAPFRLAGTLFANYLDDRHLDNANLLDDHDIRAAREHWFGYARRGAQNVLSVEIAAAIACAGLGETTESLRLVRRAHAELGGAPWPRLPADFLLGLATIRIATGDHDRASRLLDSFALGRYPESQPLGYHLIARVDGWSPGDWPLRAVAELRNRLARHTEAEWDDVAEALIERELSSLAT